MRTQALPMKPIEMIAQGLRGLAHEAAETAARKASARIAQQELLRVRVEVDLPLHVGVRVTPEVVLE